MVEFDAEDDTSTPHGSPGASSPAVDAAFFLSVRRSHGIRSWVLLDTEQVAACGHAMRWRCWATSRGALHRRM